MANTVEFNIKVNGIQQANTQFTDLDKTLKDTNISAQNLDKSLSEVAIESLNSAKSVKELQAALKQATSVQLSGALSQDEMRKLSFELGQARDRLSDVREEAASLAGTRMEIFTNALSRIREGIFNLDLDKLKSGLSGLRVALIGNATGWKAVGSAIAATGIGALVIAIGFLIANLDKVGNVLKKWIPGFKEFADVVGNAIDKLKEWSGWDGVDENAMPFGGGGSGGRGATSDWEDEDTYKKRVEDEKKRREEERKRRQEEFKKRMYEQIENAKELEKMMDQMRNEYPEYMNPSLSTEGLQEEMALQIENELLWYDERLENLKNFYEQGIITQEEYNKRSKDLNIAKMEYEQAVANQYIGILSMIGQGFALFGEENKGLAVAGVLIEKAAAIFQVISSTSVASARALAELGPVIGAPYAAAIKINGGVQAALLAVQAGKAISDINSVGGNQGSGGERAIYAKGGLLTGPSHAQGGIMTPFGELEGGEFVMNRRSTMSFLPILEELNRIGNGEPTVSTSSSKSTPIIKTYVLASDVTNQQEAQVKIKRAARL